MSIKKATRFIPAGLTSVYPDQNSSWRVNGGRSNVGVSGIGSEEETGGIIKDDSGDGSGVIIGADAGTEPAQDKERIRLAASNSTLICLKDLILINQLIPLYGFILSCVKYWTLLHKIPFPRITLYRNSSFLQVLTNSQDRTTLESQVDRYGGGYEG